MKNFELLAPAGTYEAFIAAVENGADAIYLGGKLFNARAGAANFGNEELKQIVEYAHLRGVKIYVTLNTLLSNDELPEALNFAYELYKMNIDAVIVQDLGLAKMLHEYIPNLALHASTQMTVYNLAGVQRLKALGFKCVVLARELSLDEINYIAQNIDGVRLEVFIHGALCISYSGQCLMSSMIGDRSGNRGKCAQPCRLPYTLIKNDEELGKGYLLSPKDMNTLEILSRLPNDVSLKIEGRMKSPEYVATVVSTYRKAIDGLSITKDDLNNLAQVFNRGGFTKDNLLGKPGRDLMCYEKPKNWGIYIGRVTHYDGKKYMKLDSTANLNIGDGIEVWNGANNSPSTIVSYLTNNTVGNISGNIHVGDKVYKTSDKALMQKARESYSRGFVKKSKINLDVTINEGSPIYAKINNFDFVSSYIPEKSISNPISVQKLSEQLRKTGNTPFDIDLLNITLDDDIFMPISKINEFRRELLEAYEKHLLSLEENQITKMPFKNIETPFKQKSHNKKVSLCVKYLSKDLEKIVDTVDRLYVPLKEAITKNEIFEELNCSKYILLPLITKAKYDILLKNNVAKLAKNCDGFVIANIGQLDYFDNIKTKLIANYNFNVFNDYAIELLKDYNFEAITLSPELTNSQIKAMHANVETELVVYGAQCVMTSEHCPVGAIAGGFCSTQKCSMPCIKNDKYYLRDRMDLDFRVIPDNIDCQSTIYNSKITSIESKYMNIDSIRIDVIDESIDEIIKIIDTHKRGEKMNGEIYTNGHYSRPV